MTTGRSSGAGDAPRRRSAPWSRRPRSRTTAASSSTSSSSGPGASESLLAGYVGRPHGLDGSFHVVRVDAELLAGREELLLGDRRVVLTRRSGTPDKPILRIEECASREEAEVGVVARMIALPSCEALAVGDRLIPLVRDAVRSVDLEARRIDVDLRFVDGR